MKPDLSEFEKVAPPKHQLCWGTRLSPEQQAKIQAARDAGYSYETIATVISGWGFSVSASAVPNHVRGTCKCPKS